jgi:hypothetical protein
MTRIPWQILVALGLFTFVAAELARQAIRNRRRRQPPNSSRI